EGAPGGARQGEPGVPAARPRRRAHAAALDAGPLGTRAAPPHRLRTERAARFRRHPPRAAPHQGARRDRAPAGDHRDRRRSAPRGDADRSTRHARVRDRVDDRRHLPPPRRHGAPAYPSIGASGANATILHYTANDRPVAPDELLLIDAGSERAGYCADVTRTFPTGRRYTPPQRDLYDAVLASQLAA